MKNVKVVERADFQKMLKLLDKLPDECLEAKIEHMIDLIKLNLKDIEYFGGCIYHDVIELTEEQEQEIEQANLFDLII